MALAVVDSASGLESMATAMAAATASLIGRSDMGKSCSICGILIMEELGRQPFKREEELCWGSVHPSNAHHLFDGMSSPFEVYEEDVLLIMKEVLEKFEEMETPRGKDFDETTTIKATTTDLKLASSPTPKASLPMMATKCSTVCFDDAGTRMAASSSHINGVLVPMVALELGDGKDKDLPAYIVTKDLHRVTPTMCSILGLDINAGANQVNIVLVLRTCITEGVPSPDASTEIFSPQLIAEINLITWMPTDCSMKFPEHDSKMSMSTNTKELELRGLELRPTHWLAFNYCWLAEHFLPPWSPPTEVSGLPLVIQSTGVFPTERIVTDLHWDELKAWSPCDENDISHILTEEPCELYLGCAIFTAGNTRNLEKFEFIMWTKWQQFFAERVYPNGAEGNRLIAWNFKQYNGGGVPSFVAMKLSIQSANFEQTSQYNVQYIQVLRVDPSKLSCGRELDFSVEYIHMLKLLGERIPCFS
uniref:Uncharacterized protein n=1 Tax=Oryza punctata TaxID=4537 RepID=A0A0E0JFJ7_ORYPU